MKKKSKNELKKYLDIIKYNKREYTYKIYFDKSFIGYAILVKENILLNIKECTCGN